MWKGGVMIQFFKNIFKRDKRTLDSKAMEWWASGIGNDRWLFVLIYYRELGIPKKVAYPKPMRYNYNILNEYKLTDKQIRLIYKLEHGIQ
jgi:hypothetical protein